MLGLALIIGLLIGRFSKNRLRSAFLFSLILLLFFSYGHFFYFLESAQLSADPKIVLSVYCVIFAAIVFICYKKIRNWENATRLLNVLGIVLVALALAGTILFVLKTSGSETEVHPSLRVEAIPDAPDIFYIILDGYPRRDVLQRIHQYDNSEFLSFLRSKGFRVLEQSHSNYPGTALSLASSLNFSYLEEIVPKQEMSSGNRWYLKQLIEKNRVLELLRKQGYLTAAFDSGYFATEMKRVDQFYATGWFLNEFHEALLDTTPVWVVFKNIGRYTIQRKRILYILDHLPDVRDPSKPVFVFAHIMALHPPYVFGPNGEERDHRKSSLRFWKDFGDPTPQEISQQYQDQLSFINKKVSSTVEAILGNRKRPVVIVIQGDHGSSFVPQAQEKEFYRERFSILNAILLPKENGLYDSISSVNTFRILFNAYWNSNLPVLPDRSFYSKRDDPYNWKEVTVQLSP